MVVAIAWAIDDGPVSVLNLNHPGAPPCTSDGLNIFLDDFRNASTVVAHNAKFDLGWLHAIGAQTTAQIWDTQIVEYVLSRGQKDATDLASSAERWGLSVSKETEISDMLKRGVQTTDIPWDKLASYAAMDVRVLRALHQAQSARLGSDNGLMKTIRMMCDFVRTVITMEAAGLTVSMDALNKLRNEFSAEKAKLEERIFEIMHAVMGDRPYNINSPEQLSQILYSRKVKSKSDWAEAFNIGSEMRGAVRKKKRHKKLTFAEFRGLVRDQTEHVYRCRVSRCKDCNGAGKHFAMTKAGVPAKRGRKCVPCAGTGVIYESTGKIAGFKLAPRGAMDVAAGGFATSGAVLDELVKDAGDPLAVEFIEAISRKNALDTYISTYLDGMATSITDSGRVHTSLNQCITATGRLSSTKPNLHNLPRGDTCEVRRVVVSRWYDGGGLLLEGDYKALEWMAAMFLSGDKVGIQEIRDGVDIHSYGVKTIKEKFGVELPRVAVKAIHFGYIYGKSSWTDIERKYLTEFERKYSGLKAWHDKLQDEAINTKKITLPTGRELAFPYAKRQYGGGSSFSTQIKNYPVQSFATADMVPLACMLVAERLKQAGLRSRLIFTVHDSILIDVFPGEMDKAIECLKDGMLGVREELLRRYNINFNIPIGVELKAGPNWLDMKKVGEFTTCPHSE